MVSEIDYQVLGNASAYYKSLGYRNKEVPWNVDYETSMITCPDDFNIITSPELENDGGRNCLVGSAEQGFLYLAQQNLLNENQKYVACTPCFRNEKLLDEIHQLYFMKIELFYLLSDLKDEEAILLLFIDNAKHFFEYYDIENHNYFGKYSKKYREVKIEKTLLGFDILFNNIELGSYGTGQYNDLKWVYGTGLAEPRFSSIISKHV